jgi:shikimate kinase
MSRKGYAVSHAAITVVNALATGLGAALGVDLKLEAKAELTDEPGIVKADVIEGERLVRAAALEVLKAYGVDGRYGVLVTTRSEIPIARGLKSSSAASNAVALAVARALGYEPPPRKVLEIAVKASIEAGVSVTGALDDAAASLLGGLVVTDNYKQEIVRVYDVQERVKAVLLIPPSKRYTSSREAELLKVYSDLLKLAWLKALSGEWREAMNLNGLVVASALGYQVQLLVEALRRGALAASPSGKGPALAAVVPEDKLEEVVEVWSRAEGDVKVVEVLRNEGKDMASERRA